MNPVRLWGDPFRAGKAGAAMRACLRALVSNDMRCSLSLLAVRAELAVPGPNLVPLSDGVRDLSVRTALHGSELELILRAGAEEVPSTSPVVVFAEAADMADAVRLAGLEWPRACKVVAAGDNEPAELLQRVRAELRWSGTEDPEHGLAEDELRPYLQLPSPAPGGGFIHVGGVDPDHGTDLALLAWLQHGSGRGRRLRVVMPADELPQSQLLLDAAIAAAGSNCNENNDADVDFLAGPLSASHLADVLACMQPSRRVPDSRDLVRLLASGRPVLASNCAPVTDIASGPGLVLPLGGRLLPAESGAPPHFAVDPRGLAHGLRQLLDTPAAALACGRRARQHVRRELTDDRPAGPAPAVARGRRPVVVLEAPLFELSSSSELTVMTAQELARRGHVDLRLLPTVPFRSDLAAFRRRAPDLVPYLSRNLFGADLWLSSGWPMRRSRPHARRFGVRVDWEYGHLPLAATPMVSQVADFVVVHSKHVAMAVQAAGRPRAQIELIPHGIDAAAAAAGVAPLPEIETFKAGRPAVLFVGGLVWRKGIDVLLRGVLAAQAAGAPPFVVVVKAVGGDQHYANHNLRELVERCRQSPAAPPILLIERDLDRAQMWQLYRSCDVLCHPYRGEGFAMPVLEAMAADLPVMVSKGGATDDYCVPEHTVQIPTTRRPIDLGEPHIAQPWVLEPDGDAFAALLGETLAALPARRASAAQLATAVRANCTWTEAAAAIERLAFAALGRPVPARETVPIA